MKLVLMYFSPTHSTKKIVARIGKVFFEKMLCETKPVDLTKLAVRMRSCPFDKEDVLVFGAPVYAGRTARLRERLHKNTAGKRGARRCGFRVREP